MGRNDQGHHAGHFGDVGVVCRSQPRHCLRWRIYAIPANWRLGEFLGNVSGVRAMAGTRYLRKSPPVELPPLPVVVTGGVVVILTSATLPNLQKLSGPLLKKHAQRSRKPMGYQPGGQMWKQPACLPG